MKWTLLALIFLAFFVPIIFIGLGVDHLDVMKERYKRAVDAAVNAVCAHDYYNDTETIDQMSSGFGGGLQNKTNVKINPDEALVWFYRVFFRNLGIEHDESAQQELKKYIPLKALVTYDKLLIANERDEWIMEAYYDIDYNGTAYRFTLSDQVLNLSTGEWKRDIDFGITAVRRKQMVTEYIKQNMNRALNTRNNFASSLYYDVNIAVSDVDSKTEDIDGVNFMVLVEGMPLPTLNPAKISKFYAFSLGGSEVSR